MARGTIGPGSDVLAERKIQRISWGAVFGGVAVLLVVHLFLGLIGVGIGLATVDPAGDGSPTTTTMGIGAGIYWALVAIIASFAGAFVAGRLAGAAEKLDGILNGLVTWSVATLAIVLVLSSLIGSVTSGALGVVGSTFQALGQGTQGLTNLATNVGQFLPPDVRRRAEDLFRRAPQAAEETGQQVQEQAQQAQQAAGGGAPLDALQRVVRGVQEGAAPPDRQAAINVIAQQAQIPPQEAEQRLDQFQQVYRDSVAQTRQYADAAARAASASAWVAVVVLLVGALAGAGGGLVGARTLDTRYRY